MKGSPFKLRSPLNQGDGTLTETSKAGQTLSYGAETTKKADKTLDTQEGSQAVHNEKGGTLEEQTNLLLEQHKNFKGTGDSKFDRDGRSVDKFDQRITDAESKGKLGRAQRLKNRKSGYMESQANKLEKAGGTLTDPQKRALNEASKGAGGTNAGKGLRAFFGRDAKQRKVDPLPVPVKKADKSNSGNGMGDQFGNL